MRTRRKKIKGSRRINYTLIDPQSVAGAPRYKLLRELLQKPRHEHLIKHDARIALAWCTSWKQDVDGHLKLGMCKKASDLDRELAPYDFVILLNKFYFEDLLVDAKAKEAIVYHELCHAGIRYDERSGEPVRDERGRATFRIVKHDLEEFGDVVREYGTYKRDIEIFAGELLRTRAAEAWQPCDACRESEGWVATGDGRVTRCDCWTDFHARAEQVRRAS